MNTEEAAHLDERQKAMVKDLFSQGVKHKMKVNLVRQISKTSSSTNLNDVTPSCPTISASRHPSISSRQDSGIYKEDDVFEEAAEGK